MSLDNTTKGAHDSDAPEVKIKCLQEACDEMARVIREMDLPKLAVRRMTSFRVAEFIYSGEPLKPWVW